ncbi:4957_t:CDS:2 [Entrophospora sp. SA101]|nr:4957_t:CDS:2 [Entrophospora sp. SA101]
MLGLLYDVISTISTFDSTLISQVEAAKLDYYNFPSIVDTYIKQGLNKALKGSGGSGGSGGNDGSGSDSNGGSSGGNNGSSGNNRNAMDTRW